MSLLYWLWTQGKQRVYNESPMSLQWDSHIFSIHCGLSVAIPWMNGWMDGWTVEKPMWPRDLCTAWPTLFFPVSYFFFTFFFPIALLSPFFLSYFSLSPFSALICELFIPTNLKYSKFSQLHFWYPTHSLSPHCNGLQILETLTTILNGTAAIANCVFTFVDAIVLRYAQSCIWNVNLFRSRPKV